MTSAPIPPGRPGPRPAAGPRKVRGGLKLPDPGAVPARHWAAQRLWRLLELEAPGDTLREALEYARLGQTRRLSVERATISADVQGAPYRPFTAVLRVPTFDGSLWDAVLDAMSEQAVFGAKLLAGDIPPSIEDAFAGAGARLVPAQPGDVTPSCNCGDPRPWCVHACCAAMFGADAIGRTPFLCFTLRGIAPEDVLERLRSRRRAGPGAGGETPIYAPTVPGLADVVSPPLEQELDRFWDAGRELDEVDLAPVPPPVSHPLLRRLGPSPFQGDPTAKFPLIGLLATCYEVFGKWAGAAPGTTDHAPADTSDPPGTPDGEL